MRRVCISCGTAEPLAKELRRMADGLEAGTDVQMEVEPNAANDPPLILEFTVEGDDEWTDPVVDYR